MMVSSDHTECKNVTTKPDNLSHSDTLNTSQMPSDKSSEKYKGVTHHPYYACINMIW